MNSANGDNEGNIILPKKTSWKVRAAAVAVVFVLAYGAIALLGALRPDSGSRGDRRVSTPILVEVTAATPVEYSTQVLLYGETVSGRSLELKSGVSGRVTFISQKMRDGEFVSRGQRLVSIDQFDYRTALTQAQTARDNTQEQVIIIEQNITRQQEALAAAQAELELREADLRRAVSLGRTGAVTEQFVEGKELQAIAGRDKVDGLRSALAVLSAQLEQQRLMMVSHNRNVERALRDIDETFIAAPFDGVVSAVTIADGQRVRQEETLATIIESGEIEVRFTVPNSVVARLSDSGANVVGLPVKLTWIGGAGLADIPAVVDRIAASVDTQAGGISVFARLSESSAVLDEQKMLLRPGLFMEVSFTGATYDNVVVLPVHALHGGDSVYTVQPNKSLRQVKVDVLARLDDSVVIDAGSFQPSDQVVRSKINPPQRSTRAEIIPNS